MSTCSTATSTLRGHESRRRRRRGVPPETCGATDVVEAVHGRLERRLVDLERDWDAYKTGHSGAPRHRHHHRRSRSATAMPSSAVTTIPAPPDALLLPLYRCSSPRTLVSSLQQIGSTDYSGRAAKIVLGAAGSPARSYEEGGLSSVCSVEAGHSAAAPSSSCSCPCRCGACYCRSYSTTTSSLLAAAAAAAPPFSSAAGGAGVGERARKSDEGRPVAGTLRAAWISAVALVVVVFVAMVILELRVDEGCAEYLVPT